MEGEQAIGQLQMIMRPLPYAAELGVVADHLGQQHAVGLTLTDRVMALVQPHDPAIRQRIGREEPGCRLLRAHTALRGAAARESSGQSGAG